MEPGPGAVGYAEPRVQTRVVNTLCLALTASAVCRQPPAVSASTVRYNNVTVRGMLSGREGTMLLAIGHNLFIEIKYELRCHITIF